MHRESFRNILLFLVVFLLLVPPLVTFNDVITKFVERFYLYSFLQDKVVPFEVGYVTSIVNLFGIHPQPLKEGLQIGNLWLKFSWNCLGWQSLLLFLGSLVVGLKNFSFTFSSSIKTIILGLLGIFWVNILRISFTVILAVYAMPIFKIVFHDILAAIVTIFYLFFFWWFAYSFILEPRKVTSPEI